MPKQREPTVYKRPDSPYFTLVYYTHDGKRVRRSSKATTRAQARKKLDEKLEELEKEEAAKVAFNAPIADGFLHFLETQPLKDGGRARYESSSKVLITFFGQYEPEPITDFTQVTKAVVVKFIEHRRKVGVADQTIRNDLAFLSSVWEVLADHPDWEQHMPVNPVTRKMKKRVKPSRRRLRCASDDEWAALLSGCTTKQQRQILTMLVETGMRETELCGLTWDMVDFRNRQISLIPDVVNVKDDDARVIPLTDVAIATLRDTARHTETRYVFWHTKFSDKPRPYERFQNFWREVRRRSGVKNFKLHDIRHTFATRFLNRTRDIATLSTILGHSSLDVTQKYVFLLTNTLHEQMQKLNESQNGIVVGKGIVPELSQEHGTSKSVPDSNRQESGVEQRISGQSGRAEQTGKDGVMIPIPKDRR